MKRSEAATIAAETLDILSAGGYRTAAGTLVGIAEPVADCVERTELIRPTDWRAIRRAADARAAVATEVVVTDETTLAAASRLAAERPLVLNFASAKNPGGGFLGGSRAQEESLARSSALYPCLLRAQGYYDANRNGPRATYTDHAIYSPGVPVFRSDDGSVLDSFYTADFLTMPAANAGAMRQHGMYDEQVVREIMTRRISYVLAFAAARKYECAVLGAWGCGAFGNEPQLIAELFAAAIEAECKIGRVVFAVYDTRAGQPALAAFRAVLGKERQP